MSSAVLDRTQIAQDMQTATTGSGNIKLDTPLTKTIVVQLTGPYGFNVIRETKMTMAAPTLAKIKAAIASPAQKETVAPLKANDERWPTKVEVGGKEKVFTGTEELPDAAVVKFIDP